ISIFGVQIYKGLTAWDTRKLRDIGFELDGVEGNPRAHKLAIIGALQLYLDFVNMFLFLLQLFGRRR
ncbi:MAG: Bax inhibitor-1 family protein, partial [Fretibacterium sp.]|nr:Bax inhibitor-1 family protein [Fretibacterium sp.]